MRSLGRTVLALGSGLAGLLVVAAVASAGTPLSGVAGPLPVKPGSHPFGGAAWQLQPQDLAAHGYVEEEYLISEGQRL